MPNPTLPPTKLQLRTYACKLSARKVKQGLLQLVQLHVPQAVIGLNAALGKIRLAAGLQQHARHEGQQDRRGSPGQPSII